MGIGFLLKRDNFRLSSIVNAVWNSLVVVKTRWYEENNRLSYKSDSIFDSQRIQLIYNSNYTYNVHQFLHWIYTECYWQYGGVWTNSFGWNTSLILINKVVLFVLSYIMYAITNVAVGVACEAGDVHSSVAPDLSRCMWCSDGHRLDTVFVSHLYCKYIHRFWIEECKFLWFSVFKLSVLKQHKNYLEI